MITAYPSCKWELSSWINLRTWKTIPQTCSTSTVHLHVPSKDTVTEINRKYKNLKHNCTTHVHFSSPQILCNKIIVTYAALTLCGNIIFHKKTHNSYFSLKNPNEKLFSAVGMGWRVTWLSISALLLLKPVESCIIVTQLVDL